MEKMVKIALDAMGGDFAPEEIVKGAVLAAQQGGMEILLVGADTVKDMLARENKANLPIRHVFAADIIKEGENPAFATMRKSDASIVVAAKMVKSGEADAVVTAGPTGALVASSVRYIGTVEGITRPAIGNPMDSIAPQTILIDCGANLDCKPHQLLSFGIAGYVYAKKLLHIENPTVGLLNVGGEQGKGGEVLKEAYALLQKSGLNFIGSIEGDQILSGKANVVVCDGFVGNIFLKFYESVGPRAAGYVKDKMGILGNLGPVKKISKQIFSLTSMTETASIGAGLLWGIDGIAMKIHGNAKAQQVAITLVRARDTVNADVVTYLKSEMAKIMSLTPAEPDKDKPA
jgi:phosphate acyltransferase